MEKLPMCRICLAQNTHKYVVVNKNLRNLYEKLTDIPFVTKDCRPILACFLCCARLKQCFRLKTKCLEAEEQFAHMMNEPSTSPDHFVSCSGLTRSPIEQINIVEILEAESVVIKEELPAVCEGLDDVDETDDIKLENVDKSYLDVEDIPPDHSEPDSEDDVPLMQVKMKVEEVIEVSEKTRTAAVTNNAPVSTRTELDEPIQAELKKNEPSNLKVFRTTLNRTSKPGTTFEEPDECDQRSINEVKKGKQHSRTRYECDVCQRNFSRINDLTRHIRIHTGEKPHKCHVCQCSYSDKCNLTRHIRMHTSEKPFKCDVCQCSFSEKGQLTNHIRKHTGEKPFKCDVCLRYFTKKSTLTEHIRTHTGEKPFKCVVCVRSFTQKSHLTVHIRTHTGEKRFKCDVCLRSFASKHNLKDHNRTHTGEKPFKCVVCLRSFTMKSHLTEHIRTHTGEKPFKCVLCLRSFTLKNHLTQHIRTHTGEKPFKCDVCLRSFTLKNHLTQHIRTHTGERFKCDVCLRSFTQKYKLTRHIRTHTGERFKCDVCLRSFTQKYKLTRHIRKHTGEKS